MRGLGAVAAMLLLAGCGFNGMQDLPLPGSPDVGDDSYTITAEFADVLSLAQQATVKVDGVTVGRVEEIRRDGWNAVVQLRLRGDVELPADTKARVAQTSLLGEKYVALSRPAAGGQGQLEQGDRIALGSTSRGSEVEEVLGALSLLLNGGGLNQLRTITTELDAALGDSESTSVFLRQLDTFVTTLDRNRERIIGTLENVNELSKQVSANRDTIGKALDDLAPAVRTLADQRQELLRMTRHLDRFAVAATDVVRRSGADLTADLNELRPILNQLEQVSSKLPGAVETILSFPFPDEVLGAVQGDYVNLDVLVDLTPTTLAGNVVGDGEQLGTLLEELLAGLPAIPGVTTAGAAR